MADQDDEASAPTAVTETMDTADSATSVNNISDDGSAFDAGEVNDNDEHESSSSSAQALPGPHALSHDGQGGDGGGDESETSEAAAVRQDQDDANDMFLRWARGEQTSSPPDDDGHATRNDGADYTNGGASADGNGNGGDGEMDSPALGGEMTEASSSFHADSSAPSSPAHRQGSDGSPITAQSPPPAASTTQPMDAANDMFLRWARGEGQGEEDPNGAAGDVDTSSSSSSSSSSPGGPPATAALRAAVETLEASAVPVQEQEVQNDMFLRWARGEGQDQDQDEEENGNSDVDENAGSSTTATASAAAPASANFDVEATPLKANRSSSASDVPSETKAGGQPVQHISANLFSQWASGAVDPDDNADGVDNNTVSNSSGDDDKEAGGDGGSSKAEEGIASLTSDDDQASKPSPARPGPIGLSDRAVTLPATRADLERAAGLGDPNHPLKKHRAQTPKDQHQFEQIPTAFPRPPMYSELVCLPRPLFFGSSLPPRVVEEAKRALDAGGAGDSAAQPSELKEDEADRIPIVLKPEYRNLESAMQTFGREDLIDVVCRSESSNSSRKHASKMPSISSHARRSGYVTTYQPVWGDVARKEREEKRKAAQEAIAAESFLCGETVDEVIDLRSEQTRIAAGGQSSTKAIAKPISGKALASSSKAAALRAKKAESVQSIAKSNTNHPKEPSPPHSIVEKKSDASQTAAMPSAVEAVTPSNSSVASPADNLFPQWARGDGEAATAVDESKQSSSQKQMATDGGSGSPMGHPADNDFLKWARGEEGPKDAGTFIAPKSMEKQRTPPIAKESIPSSPLIDDALPSDQRQFLQWARGNASIDESTDLGTGTFVGAVSSSKNAKKTPSASKDFVPALATDTFRPMTRTDVGLQQSDSFEGSELKKQVGMNDNLSAALASLGGGDENGNGRTESMAAAEAGAAALLAADSLILTTKAGRLKTNLELTGGREPLYGCDDMPLPIEADLGVFETKEDQVKAAERRRSQEIIREAPIPNIFGPLTCPSPCSGPDDNQSWNSRSATRKTKNSGIPLTTGFDGPAIGGASVNIASPSSVSTAGHRRSRTTSSGVKAKSHRKTMSDASQSSVKSAPIKGTGTSSGSVASTKKKNLPPPPPPITTDATFLRNQRGAYPGAGGSRTSSTEAPSISSTRSQSKRRSREANGKNTSMRVGWWTGTSTKGDEKGSQGNINGKDGVLTGGDCVQVAAPPGDDPSSLQFTSPDSDSFPSHHVETGLSPSPMTLWKQNRSFAELHPATSTAKALPFLSDRPPSTRYLQIDAKTVEFSSVGEIEPFFCTMAVWHVETASSTVAPGSIDARAPSSSSSVASSQAYPVPYFRRSGRITESLYFDVVSEPEVADKCAPSLWPRVGGDYDDGVGSSSNAPNSTASPRNVVVRRASSNNKVFKDGIPVTVPESERLCGTRCGVFPLPSNFSISNLYAVLIVHKALAEESELDAYLKLETEPKQPNLDLNKLRGKAERSSERLGRFVMPFAFGVAPLLQVIGADVPTIPSSRAVQIPLFKLDPGRGEKPIIDHIMVMLHPRAEFSGSGTKPAELTKGGSAMLVMRNFGYLGLQSVVNMKSSLARDRLVDFTGEFQLRRKKAQEEAEEGYVASPVDSDGGRVYVVPPWQPDFVAEPTKYGGRNIAQPALPGDPLASPGKKSGKGAQRKRVPGGSTPMQLYSQELAPIPLSFTPPSGRSASKLPGTPTSSTNHGDDAEILFYTSFCNELFCQPRLLHNCVKRNIVVKVELRRLQWSEWVKSYVALPSGDGPSIHNSRRGSYLVNEGYTSCAYHTLNPAFMDDFKIKLPLALECSKTEDSGKNDNGRLVLLFSVLNITLKGKKKWTERLSLRQNKKASAAQKGKDEAGADEESEKNTSGSYVQQLGCGVLPLSVSSDSNVPCLIANGLHDVKIQYHSRRAPTALDVASPGRSSSAKTPTSPTTLLRRGTSSKKSGNDTPSEDLGKVRYPPGTLILDPIKSTRSTPSFDFERTFSSDTDGDSNHRNDVLGEKADEEDEGLSSDDAAGLLISPSSSKSDRSGAVSPGSAASLTSIARDISSPKQIETMVLQVRTVSFSSVHPQNATLLKIFNRTSNYPQRLKATEFSSLSAPWALARDDMLLRIDTEHESEPTSSSVAALESVLEISKSSLCPQSDLSSHFLRVLPQLWRSLVVGRGRPELLWANPASLISLRLHTFASILHSLSSVTVYLAKNGLTQLDGRGKWNLVSMAYVVGMLFDEDDLFCLPDGIFIEDVESVLAFNKKNANGTKSTSTDPESKKLSRRNNRRANRSTSDAFAPGSILGGESLHAVSGNIETEQLSTVAETAPTTSNTTAVKVDSKADFQAALQKASLVDDAQSAPLDGFSSQASSSRQASVSGSQVAKNMINAFGGMGSGPAGTRRRWMTAPSSGLATIQEDGNGGEQKDDGGDLGNLSVGLGRSSLLEKNFGNEAFVDEAKRSGTKQMRVPRTQTQSKDSYKTLPANHLERIMEHDDKGNDAPGIAENMASSLKEGKSLFSDDDIEAKGTQFLDEIGKSMGFGSGMKDMGDEELRVGVAHHRKTRSRCSIDWTLPPTDFGGLDFAADARRPRNKTAPALTDGYHSRGDGFPNTARESYIQLPGFIDRLIMLREREEEGRWFPYTYEVVIFQWFALLVEQTRSMEQQPRDPSSATSSTNSVEAGDGSNQFAYRPGSSNINPATKKSLKDAALKARGVTIACAPILFEIIKKSLGWRVDSIFRRSRNSNGAGPNDEHLPLVTLDATILFTLEELVSMVTDACIDSRNFDSWQFRQTAIDVNDAIVRFLRDLFALLDPQVVQRLILVYFSRFVLKEGKHWQDRDSKIGLRCSWETCKLRLNAAALLVRLPDFHDVNVPFMNRWGNWVGSAPEEETIRFFDNAILQLEEFDMSGFVGGEGPMRSSSLDLPGLQHHWLVELVTEICLSATGHAEQNIQHRASSLLHELFWAHSQRCKANGSISVAASMHLPLVIKILGQINYLSSLPAKNQLRKDIFPCVSFVFQSAPVGLMRAMWRKLCRNAEGKGLTEKYGGIGEFHFDGPFLSNVQTSDDATTAAEDDDEENEVDETSPPSILDVFSLLNLALKTLEYEGSEVVLADDETFDNIADQVIIWRKEFLLSKEQDNYAKLPARPRPFPGLQSTKKHEKDSEKTAQYTTTSSRKWFSHDCAIVIVNTCRYIVREVLGMLKSYHGSSSGTTAEETHRSGREEDDISDADYEFKRQSSTTSATSAKKDDGSDPLNFSPADTVIFVRGTSSVYLHVLCLRESDVVVIKTLIASVEIVKIFGIKVFLTAVGETLQHWMRIVLLHCGARRAEVRVQALEFLALILRLTWDAYGSFLRIRLPMLAVQTEVMERIVATAATRYYREQRRIGTTVQYLTNDSAEASLAPLWRTLDRLHHKSASQNVAFRSALMRLAEMMKKLVGAYIAAHALAIMNRLKSSSSPVINKGLIEDQGTSSSNDMQQPAYIHNSLVSVHRILANSAGFSKQFLGLQGSSASNNDVVTHNEAIEDAFIQAADVFSPTELPSHRVAWLRKLAEFHESREKFAEEATCHFNIHCTLRQAAKLHDSIWASVPFLPWANDVDGVHLEGDGPASGDLYDADYDSIDLSVDEFPDSDLDGRHIEKNHSFRRIFYRVANSVRMRTGDWDMGGNKTLFYGVTFTSEFNASSPWIPLREMEEDMVEEAETAGDLYLKAGIVESSRFAWSLATQFYSETFNYAKLAHVYRRLALVVESQVPSVDTSNQLELSSPLGRFYRVWFHGGAPDELMGAEFVYRAGATVKLEKFGRALCSVLKCVLPEKTPIDLVLDDGRPEDSSQRKHNQRRGLGATNREPIKIKVTPLRPLMKRESSLRGTPEWFYKQTDYVGFSSRPSVQSYSSGTGRRAPSMDEGTFHMGLSPRHRSYGSRTISDMSSGFSASSGTSFSGRMGSHNGARSSSTVGANRDMGGDLSVIGGGKIVGVDKFSFTQPIKKDKLRGSKDWLTSPVGDFSEKTLRVTQITVEKCFPSCVSRQSVVHRAVYTQSPLEAGVEAVCSWCAVLFRTAVATNGLSVTAHYTGTSTGQGIGTAAAKVVADCIHCSRVKELGQSLLSRTGHMTDADDIGDGTLILQYMKLSPSEVSRYKVKLARSIIMFMEFLHLLIARNRDLLLEVVQARKRSMRTSSSVGSTSAQRVFRRGTGGGQVSSPESVSHYTSAGNQNGSTTRSVYSASKHRQNLREQRASMGTGYVTHDAESIRSRNAAYETDGSVNMAGGGGGASVASTAGGPNDRTDSAIAVQSELQRAFISMSKVLYPLLSATVPGETPRWLKLCGQENYFSSGTYRQTRIPMGEDLFFYGGSVQPTTRNAPEEYREDKPEPYGVPMSIAPSRSGGAATPDGSYAGSVASKHSRGSRNSKSSEIRGRSHHHRSSPSHSSRGGGSGSHKRTTSNISGLQLHEC